MTISQLRRLFPLANERLLSILITVMNTHNITTVRRQSLFLACIHAYTEGLTTFDKVGCERYGERGALPVKGRTHYSQCGAYIGENLEREPFLLSNTETAVKAAGWVWGRLNGNAFADTKRGNIAVYFLVGKEYAERVAYARNLFEAQ